MPPIGLTEAMHTRACAALAVACLLGCGVGAAQNPVLRLGDPSRHGLSEQSLSLLRQAVNDRVRNGELAGASLLVARNGEVVFREGFGTVVVDSPMRDDAMLLPILASAILLAADRGFLTVEDPVGYYLPEFRDTPFGSTKVRDLLRRGPRAARTKDDVAPRPERDGESRRPQRRTHQAGSETPRDAGSEGRARGPEHAGENRRPDPAVLICRVLEAATATPWSDWLRRSLLQRAGMDHAHLVAEDGPVERLRDVGIELTLDDLAAFAQLHLTHGMFGNQRVLSEAAIATQQGALASPGVRGRDSAMGFHRERTGVDGAARTLAVIGDAESAAWIDFDRDLVGVLFSRPGSRAGAPLLPELQSVLRTALGAADPHTATAFGETGPWLCSVESLELSVDGGRKLAPLVVTSPRSSGLAPVVLLIPGEADDGAPDLIESHWASHGFIVVRCGASRAIDPRTTARSETQVPGNPLTSAPRGDRQRFAERFGDLRNEPLALRFATRAHEVVELIDELPRLEHRLPTMRGRLDLRHIAVVGLDDGAVVALALGGMTMLGDGREFLEFDARVRAVVPIDAPGPDGCAATPIGLAHLSCPTLFIARDAVHRPGASSLLHHEAFTLAPPVDRFLLALSATVALSGDGAPTLEPGNLDARDPAEVLVENRAILLSTTTAFLDVYLRESDKSRQWLEAGGLTTGSSVTFEYK